MSFAPLAVSLINELSVQVMAKFSRDPKGVAWRWHAARAATVVSAVAAATSALVSGGVDNESLEKFADAAVTVAGVLTPSVVAATATWSRLMDVAI